MPNVVEVSGLLFNKISDTINLRHKFNNKLIVWKCVFLSYDKNACSIFAYFFTMSTKFVSQQTELCVF